VTATYEAVILLSLLSSVSTGLGLALALLLRESPRAIAAGVGFSAGMMILISIFEMLPESLALAGTFTAPMAAGLGAGVLWVAHVIIPHTHLVEETGMVSGITKSAYLVVFGLILHDLPEGFGMANAYVASPALGILVALAIALHNLPEEFAMAVPAMLLGRRRFLLGAAVLSALAEPVGALLALSAVRVAPSLNGPFLAFAAGAMLFVSVHELIPMARRYRHVGLCVSGMVASILVYALLAIMTIGQTEPRSSSVWGCGRPWANAAPRPLHVC
jgi:ZIP family zinc transporter